MTPQSQSMFRDLFTDTRAQFEAHCFKLACELWWSRCDETCRKECWAEMAPLPTKCEKLAVSLFIAGKSDARLQAALHDLQVSGQFHFDG